VATITTADFKPGVIIRIPEGVFELISAQHTHTARGSATVRAKLRNVETAQVLERTFQAKEKVDSVTIEKRKMEYLYRDGDLFHFMDPESYEQEALGKDAMELALPFLKENTEVRFKVLDDRVIGVDLPDTIDLLVTETEPGVRGDTVSGATKPAKFETGHVTQVPLFIETGEILRIDTRTGQYLGRAGR
jgi:elongation factor P